METSRIAALLAPFLDDAPLRSSQLEQISTFIDLLIRWNARVNLTAIRTPDEIVTRHFGESLFAARHLFPRGASDVASAPPLAPSTAKTEVHSAEGPLLDIGSGAGFPGLPIKIWSSSQSVTLVESNHKKVAFLREVIRALQLADISVSAMRAEDFPDSQAAVVTFRAVEHFDQTLPTAVRLMAPSARLAILIGESQLPEAIRLSPKIHWSTPTPIPASASRILAVGSRT